MICTVEKDHDLGSFFCIHCRKRKKKREDTPLPSMVILLLARGWFGLKSVKEKTN